jgi:hypothetical protein
VLIFFIAGLLYLLRFKRVDNLGAYSIPSETGLLIPSGFVNYRQTADDEARLPLLLQLRVLSFGSLEDVKWAIYPEKYRDPRKWSELSGDAMTPETKSCQRTNCDTKAT